MVQFRQMMSRWQKLPYAGLFVLVFGTALATLFIMAFDRSVVLLVNPGLVYLPIVAMLAYHWKWPLAVTAAVIQLFCVYFFFIAPTDRFKLFAGQTAAQIIVLAAVMSFVLAIVQLARYGRANAERAAGRFAALNRIGIVLASELDETPLLTQIAGTARNLTGASFAAFTLRPINELGEPLVASEGNLFYLAAVVGVTREQEEFFRQVPLGGEGLLAPIFRHGKPVRVSDALKYVQHPEPLQGIRARSMPIEYRNAALQAASDYAHGQLPREGLRSMGVPREHPTVRSFLGAPLLDRAGNVRGGLLLGHNEPDQFTQEDEDLLVGLAAGAAIALENARLYSAAQTQARELDAIFESIADGITLVDKQRNILRENRTARRLREVLDANHAAAPEQVHSAHSLLQTLAENAQAGEAEPGTQITLADAHKGEFREYIVNVSPLHPLSSSSTLSPGQKTNGNSNAQNSGEGSVVVWHDVTEAHRLLLEQQAHAETEARRALLQTVIDQLPGGVYLVRGREARLVLANRAVTEVWGAPWAYDQPMREFLAANGIRVFHFDGRPLAPDEFATLRAVRSGVAVRHHQEIIRHKDGTTLPVLVNAVALDPLVLGADDPNAEGDSEPAAIVVHSDVTALKEAERLKDEFIGIAAHELRTPLAVVKGFAQMLIIQTARGKGPKLADWQHEAITDIDQATSRLVELTEDLLDVTRLQGGRLELYPEPTDLAALIKRIATRFQVTTQNHALAVHATPEHIVSIVDPHRIEQVVTNLINNAIKYSPAGGDILLDLHEDPSTASAILSVQDHGIGIPVDQQGRIFGRFVRADNARANDIGGTGLGLYLCRELIERHQGRIWFESVEEQGSTFFVSLPMTDAPG
ncbi:MAG TPA: ATP-binding protein [Ktedonobacteraceae bacterium]|nr:ATP-binding protein [Ktedonobacteraceae bacterium]